MSNRSFIYTTNDYDNDVSAEGLSEYKSIIHPLYMLMVSAESEIIFSNVVEEDEETAIAGSFEEGKKLVIQFLELVYTYDESYQLDSFKDFITETKEILNERDDKYVVLENFEIVMLSETNFVPEIFEAIKEIRQEVIALYTKHLNGNLRAEELYDSGFYNEFDDISTFWGQIDHADMDWSYFWADTLYYDV